MSLTEAPISAEAARARGFSDSTPPRVTNMPSVINQDALLADLVRGIDRVLPAAIELRQVIHSNPMGSGQEEPTRDLMLESLPWARPTLVAGTGALVRVGPKGPSVGVRAELDALPIIEQTGVAWASGNQHMHACGHDVHLAGLWALLQAAEALTLPVGLVGLFQPREESQPSGALDIVNSGTLTKHQIRAIIGAHVQPRVPLAVASTGVGGVNAAADEFDIVVRGHGGHGAYPHVTVDPIPVMAAIVTGLHEMIGRTIDPTHPSVVTVGRIQAGSAFNIIPESGSIHGIIRSTSESDRRQLHADVRRLAEHTAAARGAVAEVSITLGDPVLANDEILVRHVDPLLHHAGLEVAAHPFRSCGADDFSHYGEQVPILMMFVGTGTLDQALRRQSVGLHHAEYLPGPESIRDVALSMAAGYVGAAAAILDI